jgi:hypothetical protein
MKWVASCHQVALDYSRVVEMLQYHVEVILLKDPHGDHVEILLKGIWSVIQIDSIKFCLNYLSRSKLVMSAVF